MISLPSLTTTPISESYFPKHSGTWVRKLAFLLMLTMLMYGCGPKRGLTPIDKAPITASIDLVEVKNDKVEVVLNPGAFTTNTIAFHIPKTVPGTYSTDDYGKYIDDFLPLDYNGKIMQATKQGDNTWIIADAKNLDKISYWVNDTYDTEKETASPVFSPAGTNISKDSNFMLNLHGFIGYFEGYKELPYQIAIRKPSNLVATTTLTSVASKSPNLTTDNFVAKRYFEVIDNPILYAKPNTETFTIKDIEVTLSVYSPNNVYTAASLKPKMEEMMGAQKAFLGDVDSTKKYAILLYLSELTDTDAQGFGALEHHTSTVVVLPEQIPQERLEQAMVDVVSHEFFHIVTPLTIHSREVQYFDFNDPKMSKHLWMYEGTTEYFANLFQIQQGLIDESEFYERLMDKITNAKSYDDTMSFTVMSQNILLEPYKANYANVYEKGTLINMALDIMIREKSEGKKGVLWLMKSLASKYGKEIPFEDDALIAEIVAMTYPEVGEFFNNHVIGTTPIDYSEYFAKVGLAMTKAAEATGFFLDGEIPYIDVDPENEDTVFVRANIPLNSSFTALGLQAGDVFKTINGQQITLAAIRPIIAESFSWAADKELNITIDRNGQTLTLTGVAGTPSVSTNKLRSVDGVSDTFSQLRNAWLKE